MASFITTGILKKRAENTSLIVKQVWGEYGHDSYIRQAGRLTARLIDPDDMGIHIKRRHEEKDKQRILE